MNKNQAIANYKAAAAAAMQQALRAGKWDKDTRAARAEVEAARVLRRFSR